MMSSMLAFPVLGIEDPWVWMAYLLCLVATVLCVAYGARNWNRGDDAVGPQDVKWAANERKVEEDL